MIIDASLADGITARMFFLKRELVWENFNIVRNAEKA